MIIRIKRNDLVLNARQLKFGYDDDLYFELFGHKEHISTFYPMKHENEYMFVIDEIIRDKKIGIIKTITNEALLKRALKYDYEMDDADYEIVDRNSH